MIKDRGKSYAQQVWETLIVMAGFMGVFWMIAQHSPRMCQ